MSTADDGPPVLRLVQGGEPTAEELAALVAAVAARRAAGPATTARRSEWSAPAHGMRRPLSSGPGAWVASGRMSGIRTRADR